MDFKALIKHLLHIGAVAGAVTAANAAQTGPLTSGHVILPALGSAGLAVIHALFGE